VVTVVIGASPAFQMVVREMSAMPPKIHRSVLSRFALLLLLVASAGDGAIVAVAPFVVPVVVDFIINLLDRSYSI
jgi:hypothetical protein